jgi:hypothetical protein
MLEKETDSRDGFKLVAASRRTALCSMTPGFSCGKSREPVGRRRETTTAAMSILQALLLWPHPKVMHRLLGIPTPSLSNGDPT